MMGKIKIQNLRIIIWFGSILGLTCFLLGAPPAQAQLTTINNLEQWGLPAGTISELIANILTWVTAFLGIASLVVLVWAGVRYMTAGGNEERQVQAKKFMTYAVIGVAFSLASLLILRFTFGFLNNDPNTTPPSI